MVFPVNRCVHVGFWFLFCLDGGFSVGFFLFVSLGFISSPSLGFLLLIKSGFAFFRL